MAEAAAKIDKKAATKAIVVSEPDQRSLVDWTPALIKAAEAQSDGGNFRLAGDLCELMLVDDRVMGATEALGSVVSLPLVFEPPEAQSSIALMGRHGDWWALFPEPELTKLIKWGRTLGFCHAYAKSWARNESGRMVATYEVWHPRNTRWDNRLKKWFAKTTTGEVEITTGDGRWLSYFPYGEKRPWAIAPWRGMSRWWLLKRYAQHDWAFYSERHGNGTEVISEEKAEQSSLPLPGDEDAAKQRRANLTADLRKLARNAKIVMPPGFTYKLHESVANTWHTFKQQVEAANTALAVALVGQNLSTEIKGGSLAAAEVHQKVESRIIRSVAESVATMAHKQVLPVYCELNFGSEPAPWPKFDTTPPEDKESVAKAQKSFADMLKTIKDAGYEVENVEEAGLKVGLKLKKLTQTDAPPPPTE